MHDIYTELFTIHKVNHNIFIETGTHLGASVERALKIGYKQIISIEPFDQDYNYCVNIFKDNSNVKLIHGYSEKELEAAITDINESCLFFLDGHCNAWFKDGTQPIQKEIEIISRHHIKTHTIIIDDYEHIRFPNVNVCTLIKDISLINSDYKFECIPKVNGILVAKIL